MQPHNRTIFIMLILVVVAGLTGIIIYEYDKNKISATAAATTPALTPSPLAVPGSFGTSAINARSTTLSKLPSISSIINKLTTVQPAAATVASNLQSAASDNYVIWTAYIISKLSGTGNDTIVTALQSQLNDAIYGTNSIPVWSDEQVTAIFPLGYQTGTVVPFSLPTTAIASVSGNLENMRQATLLNACIAMSIIAKNYVSYNTVGQAVGARQTIIRNLYATVKNSLTNINTVPTSIPQLVVVFTYAQSAKWPIGYGGGSVPNTDLQTVIGDVVAIAGTAAKIAALA